MNIYNELKVNDRTSSIMFVDLNWIRMDTLERKMELNFGKGLTLSYKSMS